MQARLLTEDMCPAFVSDFSGFHHGSGSVGRTVHVDRKGRKVGTLGRKLESFVVGKLRKSLGGWEGGWRGDWAVSLAGKEYTGSPSWRHHTYPIPRLRLPSPPPFFEVGVKI